MLRDVQFKHSYSSGYDEPKDFPIRSAHTVLHAIVLIFLFIY